MFRKLYLYIIIILFLTIISFQKAYADNGSSISGGTQEQQSFPFDNQCLQYDKSNFKVGESLLDIMTAGDFPQYCVLYSLSDYQVSQKQDGGYFIISSKSGMKHPGVAKVFLKSGIEHQPDRVLKGNDTGGSKPTGQWAFFLGEERFIMDNGSEKEFYVFQEIDF